MFDVYLLLEFLLSLVDLIELIFFVMEDFFDVELYLLAAFRFLLSNLASIKFAVYVPDYLFH